MVKTLRTFLRGILLAGAVCLVFLAIPDVTGQDDATDIGTKQTTLSKPDKNATYFHPDFVLRNDTGAAINDLEICSPKPKEGQENVERELTYVNVYRGGVADPDDSILDESNVKRVEYTDPDRVPETPIPDDNPGTSGVRWNPNAAPDDGRDWDTHCIHVSFDEIPAEDDPETLEDERVFTLEIRLEGDFRGGGLSIITVRPTRDNLFLAETFTFSPEPGTMLASATPGQQGGDIIISELTPGAIQSGIIMISPQTTGVNFSGTPFVEVASGDLFTEGAYIQSGSIYIPVERAAATVNTPAGEAVRLIVTNVEVSTTEAFSENAQAYLFALISGALVEEENFVMATTRAAIQTAFLYLPIIAE